MNKNDIIITDWANNTLFEGDCNDPRVDRVLDVNRCKCKTGCKKCDHTGYIGDFDVNWCNPNDKRNVYEYINY